MKRFGGDVGQFVNGLLMGSAHVVPGVSGGTVALIVGIYTRLIDAIAAFDAQLLFLLRERKLREAAAHVDLRFLAALGAGMGAAIVSLAKLITWCILNKPVPTWSLFFGLILASAVLVFRQVHRWNPAAGAAAAVGAVATYWICGLLPAEAAHTPLALFIAGAISISAMILPGISGSFVLVLLGHYTHVLTAVHQVKIGVLAAFGAGCAVGIIAFSKLLKFLLHRFYDVTMAFLCGMMIGALRKVWPFKLDAPGQEMIKAKHRIQFNVLPDAFDETALWALGMAVLGIILVIATDYWAHRSHRTS